MNEWARLYRKWRWLLIPIGWTLVYGAWTFVVRMLFLTAVTYYFRGLEPRLQDLSDFMAAQEIPVVGLSAFTFVLFLSRTNLFSYWFQRERFTSQFLPGLIRGTTLAIALTTAFLFSGYYKSQGLFFQSDEPLSFSLNLLFRITMILALVSCEEIIFREWLYRHFLGSLKPFHAVLLSSVFYCVVKPFQFDLGWMQFLTLFLLSISLGVTRFLTQDSARGTGFWSGLLIIFHVIFGLSVFGSSGSGLLLIKYQGSSHDFAVATSRTALFLTGGIGGPLSSFTLQFLLFMLILSRMLRNKIALNVPQTGAAS